MCGWTDWITALGTAAAGGAAVVAVFQGLRGINAWRRETAGRREFEVAEQTLASFYAIKSAIFDARSPLVEPYEMLDENGAKIDSNYAPLRRMRRDWETISRFRGIRHNFTALFGHGRSKPFEQIEDLLRKIEIACTILGRQTAPYRDPDLAQELSNDAFRGGETDPLGERVNEAVEVMENFCRKIIVRTNQPITLHHLNNSLKFDSYFKCEKFRKHSFLTIIVFLGDGSIGEITSSSIADTPYAIFVSIRLAYQAHPSPACCNYSKVILERADSGGDGSRKDLILEDANRDPLRLTER